MAEPRLLLMGEISGVFGVQGWVKIRSHTEPRDAIFRYQPWQLRTRGSERELRGVSGKTQGQGLVARIPGVDTREAAEALIGSEIYVPRSVLPPAKPGEYYWVDLEGLAVSTVDGVELGTVSRVLPTGANDVLVVQGDRERLVPFVLEQYVVSVDLDAGRIVVDWDPEF